MPRVGFEHTISVFERKYSLRNVPTYKPTRCYNPEEQHQHPHSRENLKSSLILLEYLIFVRFGSTTPLIFTNRKWNSYTFSGTTQRMKRLA
jgi:hypothetical protein